MNALKFSNLSILLLAFMAINILGIESASAGSRKSENEDPYFKIEAVKINELTDEEALEFNDSESEASVPAPNISKINKLKKITSATVSPPQRSGGIIMVIDKLVAIGEKIIPTIKQGKAVVTNNPMASVSVLPRTNAKDPVVHDMGGWSVPYSKHYKVAYTNGLGMEVVSFVYSISYQFNGSWNGSGKYLTGIRASARKIEIVWGFDLNASSQLLQISNIGTVQNVIAGATVEMSYTVSNWMQTITTNKSFFMAGNGKLWQLD